MGVGGFLKKMIGPAISIGSSFVPGGSLIKDGIKAGIQQVGGAAGAALSANANASAHNRGSVIDAMLEQQRLRQQADQAYGSQMGQYDSNQISRGNLEENQKSRFFDQMLAREKEGRDSGNNAKQNAMQAAYINKSGIPAEHAPVRSADELAVADAIKAEAMKRLQGGNQLEMPERGGALPELTAPTRSDPFTIDPKLMQPGAMEKWGGAVGTGLSMWDAMRRQPGQQAGTQPVLTTQPIARGPVRQPLFGEGIDPRFRT